MKHEDELMQQNRDAQTDFAERLAEWERKSKKDHGAKPEKPTILTCVLDDLTIEVLADALVANLRGVLVRKDELSHWVASFDQYRNVRGSDVSRWLTLHSGFFFGLDRRTDQRHYRIANPRVCLTGGIQPQILRRVLTSEFFERGLPARFLFGYPPFRQDHWNETTIPHDLRNAVLEFFAELWLLQPERENDNARPALLGLDAEAKEIFKTFYDQCGAAAIEADEREEAAWCKLTAYAARLALVGQLARDPNAEIITGEVMCASCDLARWFGAEAVRIYAQLAETQDQRKHRELIEFIERRGGAVTVRDVITFYRPLRNQTDRATEMLDALVKAERGKWAEIRPSGPGRPTRNFQLLPVSASAKIVSSRGETTNCADADRMESPENIRKGDSDVEDVSDELDAMPTGILEL
jgi:hypothetical protein